MSPPLRCLCLAGPTAAGKSAAAMALAAGAAPGTRIEIVSVDSALVYRGMDIGTAKPSPAEQALVPHHLIDLIEPDEAYSAALFVSDARRLIAEITARGGTALLAGGTMLYFKALLEGLDAMPPADRLVRQQLSEQLQREGLRSLYAELERVDPATASRLMPADRQRIQRALEVHRVSGLPISSFHSVKVASAPPPMISLEPDDRGWLHERIAERFRQMLKRGLVEEVRALRGRIPLRPDMPSMRCVGYRQTWEALETGDLGALAERGTAATRRLAKHQLTWLRSMPARERVACDRPHASEQVVALGMRLIERLASA